MSIGSRFTHTVSILRQSGATFDDYNQPVTADAVQQSGVKAAIQPKDEREQALFSQAGAGISDHTIYTFPLDIEGGDAIWHDQGDCPMTEDLPHMRFEVVGIRNAAGLGHHLEIDARAVQATPDVTGS